MSEQKTLLLIGATSDIGHATATAFAKAGWRIHLTARNLEAAERNRADIAVRTSVPVTAEVLNILDTEKLESFVGGLVPLPDAVVCVVGELGDQQRAQTDIAHAARVIRTNFEGPSLLLGILAERFIQRGHGSIVGVSSVAGDRGRGSNYVYGAAKAGFSAFLSGLRNRASASNVQVITIKPGFVRTRMTSGMKLPPLLTAEPDEVGNAILAAVEKSRSGVHYVRKIWRPVMTAICLIPEPVFKKMRL
ncbi:MAG TPA: SDR family oxidoreductase [Devosia sp.]|jgi:NAD(P)-dependent dehydrogenase (short-subunit alcohol dehydrogenase family)|uniref:SDR family oxidoreductase n=1 Tax=Devosia sp. TaxID=1871048 RepID=UPI002F920A88